ncbi:MAG: alanine--glyoxylate aminotransferase family protein [Clostridia bacterium]|nr:alanine--glyoxylate aminotransferase family protein [Clostridia bacterium]
MLNFTIGPVMSSDEIVEVANHSTPYFRTPEFSELMLENEKLMLEFMHAPANSRCVFLTSSGTGAMESMVMNILSDSDKVIVINGGSFGQRFADLCSLHRREHTVIKLPFGHKLTKEHLAPFAGQGYTALLVNMHETSSGVLYDMPMIAEFCRQNGIMLLVDAISAFIADEIDMASLGAAAIITGSQKALAVQPGVAVVVLAPEALERIERNPEVCMYLSLKDALRNAERGQTPFTPAVTTLLQIHKRLTGIKENGGLEQEHAHIAKLAAEFRAAAAGLPFDFVSEAMSNAVTALHSRKNNAKEIVRIMKDRYGIWICPNGGEYADSVFRIGHIGHITDEDNALLIARFRELNEEGIL